MAPEPDRRVSRASRLRLLTRRGSRPPPVTSFAAGASRSLRACRQPIDQRLEIGRARPPKRRIVGLRRRSPPIVIGAIHRAGGRQAAPQLTSTACSGGSGGAGCSTSPRRKFPTTGRGERGRPARRRRGRPRSSWPRRGSSLRSGPSARRSEPQRRARIARAAAEPAAVGNALSQGEGESFGSRRPDPPRPAARGPRAQTRLSGGSNVGQARLAKRPFDSGATPRSAVGAARSVRSPTSANTIRLATGCMPSARGRGRHAGKRLTFAGRAEPLTAIHASAIGIRAGAAGAPGGGGAAAMASGGPPVLQLALCTAARASHPPDPASSTRHPLVAARPPGAPTRQ